MHFVKFVMSKEKKDRVGSTEAVVYAKRFTWTAQASDILEKVTRAQRRLNKLQSV